MPVARTTVPLLPLGCGGAGRSLIERALLAVPGVLKAYVNPVTEMAYVEYDPAQCAQGEIRAAVARTGFGPDERVLKPAPAPTGGDSRLKVRRFALAAAILLAGAFALTVLPPLVVPGLNEKHNLWTLLLPGLDLSRWTGFTAGFLIISAYGLAAGWSIAALYNMVNRGASRRGRADRPGAPPPAPEHRRSLSRPQGSK